MATATETREHLSRTLRAPALDVNYTEKPELVEILSRLCNQYLPELESLYNECIWLRAKLGLDEKKDLQTSESRLLQFSSMVDSVINQIKSYHSFAGNFDFREIQLLESKITLAILPVKARLLGRLQEAKLMGKDKVGISSTPASDSFGMSKQPCLQRTIISNVSSNDGQRISSSHTQGSDSHDLGRMAASGSSSSKQKRHSSSSSRSKPNFRQPTRRQREGVAGPIGSASGRMRALDADDLKTKDTEPASIEREFEVKLDCGDRESFCGQFSFDDVNSAEFDAGHSDTELNLLDSSGFLSCGDEDLGNGSFFPLSMTMGGDIASNMCSTDFPIDVIDVDSSFGSNYKMNFVEAECSKDFESTIVDSFNSTFLIPSTDAVPGHNGNASNKRNRQTASILLDKETTEISTQGQSGSGMFLSSDACSLTMVSAGAGSLMQGDEYVSSRRRRRLNMIVPNPRKPRQADYTCSCCNEPYQCTVYENPWWAVFHHECPKCHVVQVPRIDINAVPNAIELDPNVVALYGEGVEDSDGDDFDDDGDTGDEREEGDEEVDGAEEDKRDAHPFDGEGLLAQDQASKLLVLMCHARTCSGIHASSKHADICRSTKFLMLHIRDCSGTDLRGRECQFPWCLPCKRMLRHLTHCYEPDTCKVCNPWSLPESFQQLRALNRLASAQYCGVTSLPNRSSEMSEHRDSESS